MANIKLYWGSDIDMYVYVVIKKNENRSEYVSVCKEYKQLELAAWNTYESVIVKWICMNVLCITSREINKKVSKWIAKYRYTSIDTIQ